MGVESALLALGVGAETAGAISTGLGVLSGVSSVFGGLQGYSAGQEQASLAVSQANLAGQEQARLSFKEAQAEKERSSEAERRQKLAYLASGVSLEGSPLLILEETRRKGSENVDEILRSGAAGASASAIEGRIAAKQYKTSGRDALMKGILGALS